MRIVLDTNVVLSALLDELAEVLTRPSATRRLAVIGRTVPDDADDDQVIAAAIAAGADWIVSGDADLLSMGSYQGIPIITAAQAAEQFTG